MKVLVIGGSGFIGSHIVDKLRDKGVSAYVFDIVLLNYRDGFLDCQAMNGGYFCFWTKK
tara:strand:+ start:132 stop:308 length:177 start_codon:yes stop_codon:yes gene_type:complete